MSKCMASRIGAVSALMTATVLLFAAVPVRAQTISRHEIMHRCGGVGEDAMQRLKAQAHHFNMGFWMVEGPRGAYLADVPIQIQRHGKTVAAFVADGPLCYLKAPPGQYTITGIHKGKMHSIKAHTGSMDVYLRW